MKIDIGFIHFGTCTSTMLDRAWYSLSRQDFTNVRQVHLLVNGSSLWTRYAHADSIRRHLQKLHERYPLPVPVNTTLAPPRDDRTHSWACNFLCQKMARGAEWIFLTRSDYLLNFECLKHWSETAQQVKVQYGPDLKLLVTSHCSLLEYRHSERDDWTPTDFDTKWPQWREWGPVYLMGRVPTYTFTTTHMDAGVWLCERRWLQQAGWWDERMVAWGFQQQEFHHRLRHLGVQHLVAQGYLFHHQEHTVRRDFTTAEQELAAAVGATVRRGTASAPMWSGKPVKVKAFRGPRFTSASKGR